MCVSESSDLCCFFFFSSRRRHTRCALVTGVQTCALPISLSTGGRESSTDAMLAVLADHFKEQGVTVADPIRIAAHDIKWGVKSDEGEGDEWPAIREKILAADILIFGTPLRSEEHTSDSSH